MRPRPQPWLIATLVLALFGVTFALRGVQQPRNDFHVAFLGDRTGGPQPQVYGRVWREIDLLHPDFVVTVGDAIQGSRNDETAERDWAEYQGIWKRYKHYPLYFTPGNHDIWSALSEKIYIRETRFKPHYSFDYQNAHFTILDNSRTSGLDETQMKFLTDDLKANRTRNPKFVVFHKPFWIDGLKKEGADFPLHKVAKEYGVGYIISGHGHCFVRRVQEGIVYMEVGSSGGNMTKALDAGQGFAQGRFYHFVWGKVDGATVSLAVKEIDGKGGAGRMFRSDDWDEKGPKFDPADPALHWQPET